MTTDRRQFLAGVAGLTASALAPFEAHAARRVRTSPTPTPTPTPTTSPGVAALHSDQLVETIGVNTHLNWRSTVWGQTQAWRNHLVDLGVRYHRTALGTLPDAKADYNWLRTNGGIKGLILVSRNQTAGTVGPVFNNAEAEANLCFLRDQIGFSNVLGVEGPNEPNNPNVATEGWAWRVRDHQQWLYGSAKYIAGGSVPVVAPSVYRRIPEDYTLLGTLGDRVDVANLHNYTGGNMPSVGVKGDPSLQTTLDDVMNSARAVAAGTPLWITEYGHDAKEDPALQTTWVVSPRVAARYLLRGLTLKFKRGARKIFVYSLLDDAHTGAGYGLLGTSSTYDLTPRPTYHALKRYLARLADAGGAYATTPLAYTLSGDLANVEQLLLQKRDGTWLLMVWQEVSLWDRRSRIELQPTRRSLTLTLPFAASVTSYEPSESGDGVALARGASTATLSVPGHVQILEIKRV